MCFGHIHKYCMITRPKLKFQITNLKLFEETKNDGIRSPDFITLSETNKRVTVWPSGFNCQPELRPTANGISSMKSMDSAEFRATTAKSATEIGICGMETRVQP